MRSLTETVHYVDKTSGVPSVKFRVLSCEALSIILCELKVKQTSNDQIYSNTIYGSLLAIEIHIVPSVRALPTV